jgi:hypothetical protein
MEAAIFVDILHDSLTGVFQISAINYFMSCVNLRSMFPLRPFLLLCSITLVLRTLVL